MTSSTSSRLHVGGQALVAAILLCACGADDQPATGDDSADDGPTSDGGRTTDGADETGETDTDETDGTDTASESLEPAEIARLVLEQGLGQGDLQVIETYVREDYIQHSALAADGRQGIIDAIESFGDALPSVDIARVFTRDDRVFMHTVYDFPGLGRQVAFDVFRFEDDLIAEHWDALQAWVPVDQTVSGRSMTDGPTEAVDLERTEANEQLVAGFIDEVLIGGNFEALPQYISAQIYHQHNPLVGDGLEGLGAFVQSLADQGLGFGYTENHILLGEGSFVLAGSEGFFGPVDAPPFAVFYDLFRVEDGLIVEHWDVIPNPAPDPTMLPHDNGLW